MIYKFKSKADGDVVMLQPAAERALQAMGKDLSPKGILEVGQMTAAVAALTAAVEADEQARQGASTHEAGDKEAPAAAGSDAISLRRRVWPLVEMIKRSQAADTPVTWGV